MFCTTEYRVKLKGPVTKVIQKAFALSGLAPRQKIEDTFHARGSLAARQKEGWQGKVRTGAPGWRPRGKDVSGAVGGHIGTQAQKIAFSMGGQRVWEGWANVKGGEQRCQRGICP